MLLASSFFAVRVVPILSRRCVPCHNSDLKNGGISFLDEATIRTVVVPGKPAESILIQVLKHEGEVQMPPGPKLPRREIRTLTEWVRRGAEFK